jgi:hypothetical protein
MNTNMETLFHATEKDSWKSNITIFWDVTPCNLVDSSVL